MRPWGRYGVLAENDGFKVKSISVAAGKRLSYQRHARRSEHWFIVQGCARVTLDGQTVAVDLARRCITHHPAADASWVVHLARAAVSTLAAERAAPTLRVIG